MELWDHCAIDPRSIVSGNCVSGMDGVNDGEFMERKV